MVIEIWEVEVAEIVVAVGVVLVAVVVDVAGVAVQKRKYFGTDWHAGRVRASAVKFRLHTVALLFGEFFQVHISFVETRSSR